jgi:3-oxoacyl-[acyl-carrier-protein] synthase I
MERLAITASGLITSGGFSTTASLAAARAGLRTIRTANIWDPESGTYLGAGKVPLPHWSQSVDTLADLAATALHACFEEAAPLNPTDLPVLLGVASARRPHRLRSIEALLLPKIALRLGISLHPASQLIPRGPASMAVGIHQARELIAARRAPGVVIAGVDSLLHSRLCDHYLAQRRLLTPFNSNGFSVGEAGSAVLVEPAGARAGSLEIAGLGVALEEATIESDRPLHARGLTQAIRAALKEAGLTIQQVDYRIADLNGEHYKFKEMALAMGRFPRRPTPQPLELWHPIEHFGDVGAAVGPAIAALALDAARNSYAVGPTVLCTLCNDEGERAAVVLRHQGP